MNIAFRQAFLTGGSGDAAYWSILAAYVVCFALTWTVYLRHREGRMPTV